MAAWTCPAELHCHGWYGAPVIEPSDGETKSKVVDQLREHPVAEPYDIEAELTPRVVVPGGSVGSTLATRAAGDAWDTPSLVGGGNQLAVGRAA